MISFRGANVTKNGDENLALSKESQCARVTAADVNTDVPRATASPRRHIREAVSGARINAAWLSADRPTIVICGHGGQSLVLGGAPPNVDVRTQVYSTSPIGRNLAPAEGPWPIGVRKWTDLVPAVEKIHRGGTYGETGAVAFANRLAQRVYDTFDGWPQFVSLVFGAGGTAIQDLGRGSRPYEYHLDDVRKVVSWGAARRQDVVYPFCRWVCGNALAKQTSAVQAAAYLRRLQCDLNEDIKAITGQTEDVILYVEQGDFARDEACAPFGVLLAQTDVTTAGSNIRSLGHNSDIKRHDGTHPYNAGYYQMGQKAAEKIWIDYFITPKHAFVPTKVTRISDVAWDLEFDPWVGGLVLDTSNEVMQTAGLDYKRPVNGLGFEFDDGSIDPPYVADIEVALSKLDPLTRNSRLIITLSAPPTGAYFKLCYACRQTKIPKGTPNFGQGPYFGARGCLRDEALWVSDRDIDGNHVDDGASGFPARNWAARFMVYLPR